jgi:hypothetical protein
MNEEWNSPLNRLHPGIGFNLHYGPFRGVFGPHSLSDTTPVFRSSAAHFSLINNPGRLIINGFPYSIQLLDSAGDTCLYPTGPVTPVGLWPYSIAHSHDSFTFYYERNANNTTDSITWSVNTDSYGKWRIFSAPYKIFGSDTMKFWKSYQPTSVFITYDHANHQKSFSCFWDSSLNATGDTGRIYMSDTMAPGDRHTFTEHYQYTVDEGYADYQGPSFAFDGDDTAQSSYRYHTFTMELLPHEARFLMDSNVVYRIPDRMVPTSSPYYDRASQIMRSIPYIELNNMDIDYTTSDPMGTNDSIAWLIPIIHGTDTTIDTGYVSVTYGERHYFETHPHNPGFWPVTIGDITYPAAHVRIDYFKVWDMTTEHKIAPFPN